MLTQLRLAGVLDGVVGIALGEFTAPADEGDGTASVAEIRATLGELLRRLDIPLAAGFPIGHGAENWTLPVGVRARLDAGSGTLEILEPATTHSPKRETP